MSRSRFSSWWIITPSPWGRRPTWESLVEEVARSEGQRAIFALEGGAPRSAHRDAREQGAPRPWPAILAGLANLPPPSMIAPCPTVPALEEAADDPLMRTYLQPLFTSTQGAGRLVLSWPREAFLDGDAPGTALPAAIEVAGRARILAYGPYLPLPGGQWRATAYLGFSADIEKIPFILEVDTDSGITRGFFEVENGGIFTLTLDFPDHRSAAKPGSSCG